MFFTYLKLLTLVNYYTGKGRRWFGEADTSLQSNTDYFPSV